jgi:glutamate formiminotransferase/formiminotetrahydrofolate cyclodeaminase
VLEYQAGLVDGRLVSMTNREFVDELSSDSPAPGGGSVAALCAAQAAGLVAMVGNLTVGKKKYKAQDRVKEIAEEAQELKDFFLDAVDGDTEAFNRVMGCFGMPKKTAEQQKARDLAIAEATRGATRVPFSVLEKLPRVIELAAEVSEVGNQNSLSDAGVAVLAALTGAEGAYYNVLINLGGLQDLDQSEAPEYLAGTRREAMAIMGRCEEKAAAARKQIRGALEASI